LNFDNKICVIIPAHNEELVIAGTIRSLMIAGLSPGNIYVADDKSSDNTAEISDKLGAKVISNQANLGKAKMLEVALKAIGRTHMHKYVSILDADTAVDEYYFKHVLSAFELDKNIAAVCGQPRSIPHNWLTAYRSFEYAFQQDIFRRAQSKMGVITIIPGCAATFGFEVLGRIKMHDWFLTEDADITTQIHINKLGRVVYEPKALVYTQDPSNLKDYIKQVRRWYMGAWQNALFHRLHPLKLSRPKGIDWEWSILLLESLLYSIVTIGIPLALILGFSTSFKIALSVFITEEMLLMFLVLYYAHKLNRFDVVMNLPYFIVPKLINSYLSIESFFRIILNRKTRGTWLSPQRYEEVV
jgi:poly-beta-1,6-N-acetyl-D-glucosamine synthase